MQLQRKKITKDCVTRCECKHVFAATNRIVEEKGSINVVINNAGYLLFGAFEDTSIDEIRAQFETNFLER